jgi:formylglycine-generating enzyme required for sulfatase activity
MEQRTVFISYRRALSKHLARAIYLDLQANGWDVFLDVNTIDSGDFDRIILNQIGARAHFILLISPKSLERCANNDDWVLREIQEAVRLKRNIVPIIEEGVDFSREVGYLPSDVRTIISKKSSLSLPHFFFDAAVELLRTRFLKTPEYIMIIAPQFAERAEVQHHMSALESEAPARVTKHRSIDLLPTPFAWVEIPKKGYSIAKYPVTNAQFRLFVEAGGYSTQRWWAAEVWRELEIDNWIEPRYWRDMNWNCDEHPVVGVSWYEAVAFCQWLSETTGEKIMLPTARQWQYAAQGDDRCVYPWGNDWDKTRCNNNVDGKGIGRSTPVRTYEGKGDSPFGVVDMVGNVWEWCLTNHYAKVVAPATERVMRGGSWSNYNLDNFRAASYINNNPIERNNAHGFRLARSS